MSSKMKARIAALVAKGSDAAASEAEAMSAIAMADKLMDEHGLALEDVLGDDGEKVGRGDMWPLAGRLSFAARYFRTALCSFCGVRAIMRLRGSREVGVAWVGYPSDVAMAEFLSAVIERAIMVESRKYDPWMALSHDGSASSAARVRREFAAVMAHRIGQRLHDLADARSAAEVGGRNALAVVRDSALEAFMISLGLEATRRRRPITVDFTVMAAGLAAGDQVHLGRPVQSDGADGPRSLPG